MSGTTEFGDLVRKLAARPSGLCAIELKDYGDRRVWSAIHRAVKSGALHRAKISHRVVLFFTDAKQALDYVNGHAIIPPSFVIKKTKGWDADTPAIYPTDSDGKPLYKVTIGPSMPQPTYSNTHDQ